MCCNKSKHHLSTAMLKEIQLRNLAVAFPCTVSMTKLIEILNSFFSYVQYFRKIRVLKQKRLGKRWKPTSWLNPHGANSANVNYKLKYYFVTHYITILSGLSFYEANQRCLLPVNNKLACKSDFYYKQIIKNNDTTYSEIKMIIYCFIFFPLILYSSISTTLILKLGKLWLYSLRWFFWKWSIYLIFTCG